MYKNIFVLMLVGMNLSLVAGNDGDFSEENKKKMRETIAKRITENRARTVGGNYLRGYGFHCIVNNCQLQLNNAIDLYEKIQSTKSMTNDEFVVSQMSSIGVMMHQVDKELYKVMYGITIEDDLGSLKELLPL
jgi:hypothetical protein